MPIIFEYDPERHPDGLGSAVYSHYWQWRRDNEYYRRWHFWNEQNLVIGAKVWRGNWHAIGKYEIREGEITSVTRGNISSGEASWRDDPNGESIRWGAKFARAVANGGTFFEYYWQTCDGYEFHSTRQGAIDSLVRDMTRKLEDCVRDQIAWEQAINKLQNER